MAQTVTMGTATAAGGTAGAAVVFLDWLLPPGHQMPPDVAAALMVLLTPALHTIGSIAGTVIGGWLAKRGVAVPATAATP